MDEIVDNIGMTTMEKIGEGIGILASAIPAVGGVISGTVLEIVKNRQNRRLNSFIFDLAYQLQSVKSSINEDFVKTEDFEDMVELIFSRAADTRQQVKLDALRDVFTNAVLKSDIHYEEIEEVTDLLMRSQRRYILLLRILADPEKADEQMGQVVGKGRGISTSLNSILRQLLPEWDSEEIERTWQDLLTDQLINTPGTKTMITDKGIHQLENRLTTYGNLVVGYLTQHQTENA